MDRISKEQRSKNMSRIRSTGTKPEMRVRRLAHALGYRFRLHRKDLPGRPDLVFPGRHKAIFVHGCFWHQHDDPNCNAAHSPRSNTEYWTQKLAGNVRRDIDAGRKLREAGWSVLILWECELKDQQRLQELLTSFLDG